MNCGMSVYITNLTKDDFSEKFLKIFTEKLRAGVYPRRTRMQMILARFGLHKNRHTSYDLTNEEFEAFLTEGAPAAIKKYNLSEKELEHMEYGGVETAAVTKKDLHSLVPKSAYVNGRHEMGYNFGRNHFLEIHYVEDIIDEGTAQKWNLKKNQLIFYYHGGGGHATYHLGRYFGNRIKNTSTEKAILFILKIPFHFLSWNGIKGIRARWRMYFSRKPFPGISASSKEGVRLMKSIGIALNYGYGFRVALLRRIQDALPEGTVSLLWDAAHNSIRKETHNGQEFIVHRNDAVHVLPDNPVMIAGFHTRSYIGIGGTKTNATFASASQSAGRTIDMFDRKGKSKPDFTHYTLVSKRKEKEIIKVPHRTDEGLQAVITPMEEAGIVKPVAYIRPLAIIKGH